MFKKNDYVMYGAVGVCQVEKVDYPDFLKEKEKQYYFLKPLFSPCDNIFVPVENEIPMRKILTKQEANELIEKIPEIDTVWVGDESARESMYKEAIHSLDSYALLKIVKTLYLKMSERKKEGKKPLSMDEKYMSMAEEYLNGELSVALDIPLGTVVSYISQKVQESTAD